MIAFTEIYYQGFEVGHDAKRAGVYIPNPYLPSDPAYEHYRDGYDLGVMAAKIDMSAEEKVVDISTFRVDIH